MIEDINSSDLGESPLLEDAIQEREYKAPHETFTQKHATTNTAPKNPAPQNTGKVNQAGKAKENILNFIGKPKPKARPRPQKELLDIENPAVTGQRMHEQKSMAGNQFVPPPVQEETVFQDAQVIDEVPEMQFGEPDWGNSESSDESNTAFKEMPKDSMKKSVNATAQLIVSFIEKIVPEGAAFISNINEDQAYELEKDGEIIEGSFQRIVDNNRSQKKEYQISQADADQLVETLSELLNSKGTELSPEARLMILLVIILIPIGLAAFQNKKRNKRFLEQLLAETKGEINSFKKRMSDDMDEAKREFQNEVGAMKSEIDRGKRDLENRQSALEQERARLDKDREEFFNKKKNEVQSVVAEEVN